MTAVTNDSGVQARTGNEQCATAPGQILLSWIVLFCVALSLAVLVACGGGASSNVLPPPDTQDFQVSAPSLSPATIPAGSKATSTVTITPVNGFNGQVMLACSGLPGAASCSFNPSSITGSGTSQLTVATAAAIVPGRYPFNVSGISSSTNHNAKLILGVAQLNGTIQSSYFGIVAHDLNDPDWTQVAPFGADRLWDTGTQWNNLQPTNGPFNWKSLDRWMAALKANGITRVDISLGGTARWASSDPDDQNADCDYAPLHPPDNYGYCAPPSDLNADGTGPDQYWKNWVATLSQHLQSVGSAEGIAIDAYEPWNEFTRQAGNEKSGVPVAWEGTNQQLVRMVQDARCIIIGNLGGSQTAEASGGATCAQVLQSVNLSAPVDPSAIFFAPNTGLGGTAIVTAWDSYMNTPGAADAADGYAFHVYKTDSEMPLESTMLPALLAFESDPTVVQGMLDGKPAWATEGGWHFNSYLPDPDDQAAFVARDYLLLFSVANLQRFYWYALDESCKTQGCDNTTGGNGTLLIPPGLSNCTNPNGCIQAGGVAYGQVYNWMTGATQSAPCNNSPGTIWTCGFTRSTPSGYQAEAIWDPSQTCSPTCTTTPFDLGTNNPYVQYRDLAGDPPTPIVNNTVPVGEKPILLENMSQ